MMIISRRSELNTEKIKNIIARALSTLFLPPLILTWSMLWILFARPRTYDVKVTVLVVLFILGVIIPITFFIIMVKRNKIADQDARNRSERHYPYILGICLTILGQYILIKNDIPADVRLVWMNYMAGTILIFVINLKWKISAHLMSNAIGVLPIFVFNYIPWYLAALFLCSIGWARLQLNCHTIPQVLLGAVSGGLITFVNYKFLF